MINVLKPHDYAMTDKNKMKPFHISHHTLSKVKSMSEEPYCYDICEVELGCSKAAYVHGQLLDADMPHTSMSYAEAPA